MTKFSLKGLRAKILYWSFIPAALVLSIAALVAYLSFQNVTRDLILGRSRALVQSSANQLTQSLAAHARALSDLPVIENSQTQPRLQEQVFRRLPPPLDVFDGGVVWLDSSGVVRTVSTGREDILGVNFSDRSYFQAFAGASASATSPSVYYSNLLTDGPAGSLVVVIATPVVSAAGDFEGVMAGMFKVGQEVTNVLYSEIAGQGLGQLGSVYLLDREGRVLYHSQANQVGEDYGDSRALALLQQSRAGAQLVRVQNIGPTVLSYVRLGQGEGLGWSLVTEENWNQINRQSRNYQALVGFLLVLGLVVPALVMLYGSRQILTPIRELTEAAQQVADGNFRRAISPNTGDELEVLAEQFNRMAHKLEESYATLEAKVAARTRELLSLNRISEVANQSLGLDEILQRVLVETLQLMGLETGGIYLLEKPDGMPGLRQRLYLRAYRGEDTEALEHMRVLDPEEGSAGLALTQQEPVVLRIADYPPGPILEVLKPLALDALVSIPVIAEGQPLGVMTLAVIEERFFGPQDLDLLRGIGRQLGLAIAKARLLEQVQRELFERTRAEEEVRQLSSEFAQRNVELALLNRVVAAATSQLSVKEILEVICRELALFFGVPRVSAALFNEARTYLTVSAEHRTGLMPSAAGVVLPVAGNLATQEIMRDRLPLAILDVEADPRLESARGILREQKVASIMLIPLITQGEVVGTIGLDAVRRRQFTPEEISFAANVAAAASQVLERVRAEAAMREAKETAEQANRSKSAFLANMSHELRTPLNAILGFSQLLMNDANLNIGQRQNIQTIVRSGEHLLTLINDVLEMSKIEAGRTTLNIQPVDLLRMLANVESMFHLRAIEKGLDLIFERDLNENARFILTDESKLRQVIINLVGNAIKFTNTGEVILRAWHEPDPDQPDEGVEVFRFEVEDSGPGISEEDIKTLFTPFVQTSTGQKTHEGTGLGLAISRNFVQLLGGELTVRSQVGEGSVFAFTIKASYARQGDFSNTGEDIQSRRVLGLKPGQKTYRLLVVEDKDFSRELLVRLLAPLGFELREASNGEQAVEVFHEWRPDLIWMDMRMPVMDGHEATRRIKSTPEGQFTHIIALTASAFEEDRQLVLSEGCDDFIRKPFREVEIYTCLEKFLGVQFLYADEGEKSPVRKPKEESLFGPLGTASSMDAPMGFEELKNHVQRRPAEWINALRQAAMQADGDQVNALVVELEEESPAMAQALQDLVYNFRFDTILLLTQ